MVEPGGGPGRRARSRARGPRRPPRAPAVQPSAAVVPIARLAPPIPVVGPAGGVTFVPALIPMVGSAPVAVYEPGRVVPAGVGLVPAIGAAPSVPAPVPLAPPVRPAEREFAVLRFLGFRRTELAPKHKSAGVRRAEVLIASQSADDRRRLARWLAAAMAGVVVAFSAILRAWPAGAARPWWATALLVALLVAVLPIVGGLRALGEVTAAEAAVDRTWAHHV